MKDATIKEVLAAIQLPEGIDNPDCTDSNQRVIWFNVDTDELLSAFSIYVTYSITTKLRVEINKHLRLVMFHKSQQQGHCITHSAIIFNGKAIGVYSCIYNDNEEMDKAYRFTDRSGAIELYHYLISVVNDIYKTTIPDSYCTVDDDEKFIENVYDDVYYIKPEISELLKGK